MDPVWRLLMNDWLCAHAGVISTSQLLAFGCERRMVCRMVERHELVPMFAGVFRSAHWPHGRDQLMTAACVGNPNAVVAFTTAASLWGFRRLPHDSGVHVLVPHGCSPTFDGVTVHRCRRIDAIDIVQRTDGIRLTSPTRTLFDSADQLGIESASSVLEQLINDGRGTFATHASTVARLGHSRRPGTRTMVKVIGSRPAWRKAMQSDLEARVLNEMARQNLPVPRVQYPFRMPDGRRIRFDFAWPTLREALEVDHPFWHAGASESHRDKHRDRKMGTVGWHTTRITSLDIDGGLRESIADVAAILAQARPHR